MARFYQSKTRVVNLTKDQNQKLKLRQGFADIHSGRVATLEVVLSSASIAPCCAGKSRCSDGGWLCIQNLSLLKEISAI